MTKGIINVLNFISGLGYEEYDLLMRKPTCCQGCLVIVLLESYCLQNELHNHDVFTFLYKSYQTHVHFCPQIAFQVLVKALISLDPGEDMEFLKKQFQEFIAGLMSIPINIPGSRLYRSLQAS